MHIRTISARTSPSWKTRPRHPTNNAGYVRVFGDDLRGEDGRRARADADIVQVRLQIAY